MHIYNYLVHTEFAKQHIHKMESEKKLMIEYFSSKEAELLLMTININNLKPNKKLKLSHVTGSIDNNICVNHNVNDHLDMWRSTVENVLMCCPKSELLATAYTSRAELLYHLRKYKESNDDIDKALKITKSTPLKIILYCHKVVNSKAACVGGERNSYEKACYLLNKINKDDKSTEFLTALIKRTGQLMDLCQPDMEEKDVRKKLACVNEALKINYNKKFGRHLVATRDIKPGEIICVEKFFAVSCFPESFYYFCTHCLNLSWTLIPCDSCNYNFYCSETCKRKAWEMYHDVECSVAELDFLINISVDNSIHLALRLVIMAIKETGSIEKLKNELKYVDNCKDNWAKGMKGSKFSTFRSIYSLSDSCDLNKLDALVCGSAVTLIALLKFTKILGKNYTFNKSTDLIKDNDVIFISALILKFSKIAFINSKEYFKANPPSFLLMFQQVQNKKYLPIKRGIVIAPLCSLINHSCNPNVDKVFMDNGKICYYSILPIKKNEQIFDCYYLPFYSMHKSERRKFLSDNYNFRCYCEACSNNWTIDLIQSNILGIQKAIPRSLTEGNEIMKKLTVNMYKHFQAICKADIEYYELKAIKLIAEDIEFCVRNVKFPCAEVVSLIYMIWIVFEHIYGSIDISFPEKCGGVINVVNKHLKYKT